MSLNDVINEQRKISDKDIQKLKAGGHKLDDSKTYVFKFLFNDKLNDAVDPIKYKLDTKDLDKYAKQSIGRPYIVRSDGNPYHVRIKESGKPKDDIQNMIELQQNYAVGDIRSTFRHESNNVYGIIEVYDEYIDDIPTFPPYTSPTFYLHEMGSNGSDVVNGEFLNIQAVPDPGYARSLAGIKGTCTGGIDQCTKELRVLGAAGGIKDARSAGNLGINTSNGLNKPMSATQDGATADQKLETIASGVTQLTTAVTDIQKQQMAIVGIVKEIGGKTGVDTTKLGGEPAKNDDAEGGSMPDKNPPGVAGAAGGQKTEHVDTETQKQLTELQKQLKVETKARQEAEAKTALTERTALAENIAKSQAQLHMIESKDIPDRVKELIESKTGDSPTDLTLTASVLTEQVSKIAGASGAVKTELNQKLKQEMAILGASGENKDDTSTTKNVDLMGGIM